MFVLTCVFLALMMLGGYLALKYICTAGETIRGLRKDNEILRATNSYLTDKAALAEKFRLQEREEHLKTINVLRQLESQFK